MKYRCVKSNSSNEVLAIGYDENQSNQDYNGIGIWQDFTFEEIPTIISAVQIYADENEYMGSLHKVIDTEIVSKTIADIS